MRIKTLILQGVYLEGDIKDGKKVRQGRETGIEWRKWVWTFYRGTPYIVVVGYFAVMEDFI